MPRIRTAVFPVAGRGTRFLPATKASPKEMLPIVDKPLIQYAVEEAIDAGADRLVFITGSSKRAIEDHFDTDAELERQLTESGKHDLLKLVRDIIPPEATCIFVRQGVPLGLGHAVLCAKHAVGDEPFFVHLADDLIYGEVGCLAQMRAHFEKHGASVLGVETVPRDQTGSYGIVAVQKEPSGAQRVTRIVEKPKPADAPSNLAVVGRYILTPAIFGEARAHAARRGWGDPADGRHRGLDGGRSRCTCCRSPGSATTAAASSAICARWSSTACAIRSSARASAPISTTFASDS